MGQKPYKTDQVGFCGLSLNHFISGFACSNETGQKSWYRVLKGALDKYNIIPQPFPKIFEIFIPLEVLARVMTACQVLPSTTRLTYFWRNMNIPCIFYFSKSTSINTQYSSLWDTLEMMLFTKYLLKLKRIGRISWKFQCLSNIKFSIELDVKRYMLYLSNAPLI